MEHVTPRSVAKHIKQLQAHLAKENPVLLDVVKSFRQLDGVAYRLGLLNRNESLTTRVPWWPMIAVLGTFSSGKSTFINGLLGRKLQLTGNQAVDDRFTVICYAAENDGHTLPGRALDADPRFPFFQISDRIEQVHAGEGARIDAYLQLKTTPSPVLRGKILIDSPGFDADAQRTATLQITDHIIDLSDLVLVFFDARHPEPGAMHDTLEHLVGRTIHRPDSSKFMYILNQIDNAAREDNPEEVFAAWQRALAGKGLTAGRFYAIFSPEAAIEIHDPALNERFQSKRAQDMQAIEARLAQVEVDRAYRIIGVLENTAKAFQDQVIPRLREARRRWRRRTVWLDGTAALLMLVAFMLWSTGGGLWQGLHLSHPLLTAMNETWLGTGLFAGGLVAIAISVHLWLRQVAAHSVLAGLRRGDESELNEWVARGFRRNMSLLRPMLGDDPTGSGLGARRRLQKVLNDADRYVQDLNNRFANPSGSGQTRQPATAPVAGAASTRADVSVVKSLPLPAQSGAVAGAATGVAPGAPGASREAAPEAESASGMPDATATPGSATGSDPTR
jgi:ribosome biogenesis GTPase A